MKYPELQDAQSLFAFLLQSLSMENDPREKEAIAFRLLEYLTGLQRKDWILNKPLPAWSEERMEEALRRLKLHEPIQYIIGEAPFYGRTFRVSPAVLIPRSETEELVHEILLDHKGRKGLKILDLCTGSGCIAITLAKELPEATVYGLDVSMAALEIAKQNALHLKAEIEWIPFDLLLDIQYPFSPETFDIIVSNPPYVTQADKEQMSPKVLAYEPHLALFPPPGDDLIFYRKIAGWAAKLLKKEGKTYIEINELYLEETNTIFNGFLWKDIKQKKDIQGKNRMIITTK